MSRIKGWTKVYDNDRSLVYRENNTNMLLIGQKVSNKDRYSASQLNKSGYGWISGHAVNLVHKSKHSLRRDMERFMRTGQYLGPNMRMMK